MIIFPDGLRLKADGVADDLGRFPAEVESGGDDGEDAGNVEELIGQKIADVGREERNGEEDLRPVADHVLAHPADELAHDEAHRDAADGDVEKFARYPDPFAHGSHHPRWRRGRATLKMTRLVASLTRLSPSRMVTTRRGRPSRWPMAEAGDGVGR